MWQELIACARAHGEVRIDHLLDRLSHTCDVQSEALVWFAVDPMLDALRPDHRFACITPRIGLDF